VSLIRKRAGGIHHGQESLTPLKAEYIGADLTVILSFSLAILRRTNYRATIYRLVKTARRRFHEAEESLDLAMRPMSNTYKAADREEHIRLAFNQTIREHSGSQACTRRCAEGDGC